MRPSSLFEYFNPVCIVVSDSAATAAIVNRSSRSDDGASVPFDDPSLRVRRMTSADIDEIVRIEREIYPFPWTPGNFRDSLRAGYLCWVMTDAAERTGIRSLLGYCIMMQVLDEAHLMNLSVSAEVQRCGHGRRLLSWLMALAAARGAHGMFLEVRPSNTAAIGLYRNARFERIGLRRNYYPNGPEGREDALVMRCDLRASR